MRWYGTPFAQALWAFRRTVPPRDLVQFSWRFAAVERLVPSPHNIQELAAIASAVLARPSLQGDVVECGCFKGGSTARLSLACARARRKLVVYDSFEGLPTPEPWDARHEIRRPRVFAAGEYAATLDEVRANVAAAGAPEVCTYVPGWFEETMAHVPDDVAVAFVDADLTESIRVAVAALWPRLVAGGVLFIHDATDPQLRRLLAGRDLWQGAEPVRSIFPDDGEMTLAEFHKGTADGKPASHVHPRISR